MRSVTGRTEGQREGDGGAELLLALPALKDPAVRVAGARDGGAGGVRVHVVLGLTC